MSYSVKPDAAAAMIEAGRAALPSDPVIEIDSFGRLRLRYEKPDVARIFEAMDAARIAADGLSVAEVMTLQLGEALAARGLSSLDALLDVYDRLRGSADKVDFEERLAASSLPPGKRRRRRGIDS